MRYWRTIQKDCPSCHGRGEVWHDEIRSDGYWTTAMECHCVEHHHDDEMKDFLARVTGPVSSLTRGSRRDLYELGYSRASQNAACKGGTINSFRVLS